MIPSPFLQLFVAFGLGLLVGLQREWVDPAIAGIRTFALITVLSALAALLGRSFGGWIVAVRLLVSAALVLSGTWCAIRRGGLIRVRRRSSRRWSCTASGHWW